jgi:hypothetical protein
MDDEKQIGRELQHDSFADAPDAGDDFSVDRFDGWIDRSEDERTVELQAIETVANDESLQRVEIDNNVGQFRQSQSFFSQSTICSRVQ